nr:trans-resveratrol di-o-methyltransferase [Quercus suber]
MRLLVHCGFFVTTRVHINQEEEEEEAYDLTPSSRILLKENVTNLLPFLLAMLDPVFVSPWHFLKSWFRGDKVTPFESAHGMGFWDYADQNPDFNDSFNKAMASDSGMMNLVVKDCKPVFEGLDTLVDVGGGIGTCARIISEAFPHLKCTVLEPPHVVANLQDSLNLNFVGGDMFQSIPSANAILLKLVLHALSDEECVKVLNKCREAIANKGKEGKVIIIDIAIDEKKDEHEVTSTKLFFDMLMMVVVTGRERHEKEWEKLFVEAALGHGNRIAIVLSMRWLCLIVTHNVEVEVEVFHQLHYSSLASSNLPQFSRVSSSVTKAARRSFCLIRLEYQLHCSLRTSTSGAKAAACKIMDLVHGQRATWHTRHNPQSWETYYSP